MAGEDLGVDQATFDMTLTGTFGGPCPVCEQSGELVRHHGFYGPNGMRTLIHLGGDGVRRECTIPTAQGWVDTVGGRWDYRPGPRREEELERQRQAVLDYLGTIECPNCDHPVRLHDNRLGICSANVNNDLGPCGCDWSSSIAEDIRDLLKEQQ